MKDGDKAIGADHLGDIKAIQLLLREGFPSPRLEVFAKAALLVKTQGISLADTARQILILDGDAFRGNLETDNNLLARCELL